MGELMGGENSARSRKVMEAMLKMGGRKQNMGPDIAWFKDPAGNFLSVIEDAKEY
jgi:hypothetical protein